MQYVVIRKGKKPKYFRSYASALVYYYNHPRVAIEVLQWKT